MTRLRQALLPVFLPVFAVTSLGDLGHGFGVSPGGSPFVSSGLALGGLVLLGMGLPWLLKWCWGCRPIEDPHLRSQLGEWCRQFGVPVREICLWPTQGQILNAVVCGILPGFRMIFLTDRLIQELTRDQLRCVLAHEFAHIRQRHALRQMAIIAVPVLGWAAFLPPTTIGPLATGLLLVTLLAPLLAWTGRLAEHEADFSACLLLSWTGDAGLRPAVERYIQMLVALHGPPPHPTWHWLHPPLSARKRFLARLDRPQVSPSRYLRGQRIGLWTAVLLVAFAVPFLVRSNSPGTVAITRVVRSSSGKWAQVTASCHRPASNPSPILVVLEQSNFELSAAV